ncbi:MAG: glycosyltransferase [Pseudomonadota bacterium]
MTTVAIVSVGITGRLNASFELARRLGERGCSVVIASLDARAGERVLAAGLAFFPLHAGVPQGLRDTAKRHKAQANVGFFARRRVRADIARARGEAAIAGNRVDALIETHAPDLVLVESELHDTIIFCLSLPVRMALLEYHVSTRRLPGVPPLGSTLTPAAPLFRLRAAAAWRWNQVKRLARRRYRRWYHKGWDEFSVWQRIAEAHDVDLRAAATATQWPMLHYPNVPCLHLCAAEFDFPHPDPDERLCVGPMVQKERAMDSEDAQRCCALLERLADSDRPLVVCATGSILSLPAFLKKVVAAADGQPWDVIVATGRGTDPAVLGTLPDNVHAFGFIPQLAVLDAADLFLCHGGISSVHEALLHGVPMLVYSGGCMDEDGNAARVEWHRLGKRGDMARDDARVIRRNITTLLNDAEVKRSVERMRQTLEGYEVRDALSEAIRHSVAGADLLR